MQISKHNSGFTLVEVLVAVSLIAILSSVVYFSTGDAGAQSRDAKRQADLRLLQSAIELYKNENGEYPEGCNGPGNWSGHHGDYKCSTGTQYIEDLAPKFIPTLPTDPKPNGDESGYVYTVNSERTVYKLMAKNTVESETVTYDHKLRSCDYNNTANYSLICNSLSASQVGHCRPGGDGQFESSYGVWGGFADGGNQSQVMNNTRAVVCLIK